MTTRNSSIRLSLDSGSFTAQMRSLTGRVGMIGRQMGSALSRPLGAGFTAAKQQLAGLADSMKSTIKQYGTLAGTIATGLLTKDAIELQGIYRTLAFDMSKLGDGAMDWKTVQEDVSKAALATGQRAREMAGAYGDVYRATGDIEYSKQVLEAIGTAATASGDDIKMFATAAQMMMRKFNMTAEQVPDAMAAIAQQTNSGAIGLDGLNSRFGMLAGEAKMAGMTGVSGMTDLLGLFRLLDSEMGEKLTPALTMMFQTMKAGTSYAKEFRKIGVKFEPDMSFLDKFKQLLQGKGRIIAQEKFTGFSRNAFDLLAKPFDDALKEAESKGMRKAEAIDYAMTRLDKAFSAASDTTWKYSDLQRKAAERIQEDPAVKLRVAIGKLEAAMSQPKMIRAIETLADKLPVLADKFAELIDWIVNNPWKAAGVAVGAKVAMPAVGAALGTAGSALLGAGAGAAMKGAGALLGAGAATEGAAAAAAMTAANAGAGAATAAGGAGIAGALLGTGVVGAIGAGAGYAGYKAGVEPAMDWTQRLKMMDSALREANGALTSHTTNVGELTAVLDQIRSAKKSGQVADPGMFVNAITAVTKLLGGEDSADRLRRTRVDKLSKAELMLIDVLRKLNDGAGRAATALKQVGEGVSSSPGIENPSRSGRGVRKPSNKLPGAAPVEG